MIEAVCVYCGSSSDVDETYKAAAKKLGETLASEDIRVIYGGGHVGLMGIVADSALKAGGEVVGIIPEFITAREVQHDHLTELHVVKTMHERKMMMAERADGFVVLPGGFGTLDEFFEILTWRQLEIHEKPILLVNINGYWDGLKILIDKIIAEGFARPEHGEKFKIVEKIDEILPVLAGLESFQTGLRWDRI